MSYGQRSDGGQSHRQTTLDALQIQLARGLQQACEPTGMLIVDEDVELAVSKQNQLMLKTVLLALNVKLRIRSVFL